MNRRNFALLATSVLLLPRANAGAWEAGSFDNDDAMDWVGRCTQSKGTAFLSATLHAALVEGELEAPEGSAAIAAAEVVAASKGRMSKSFPKELSTWLDGQSGAEIAKLAPLAGKAVSRVLNGPSSELQELWQENTKAFPGWKNGLQGLISRLTS